VFNNSLEYFLQPPSGIALVPWLEINSISKGKPLSVQTGCCVLVFWQKTDLGVQKLELRIYFDI